MHAQMVYNRLFPPPPPLPRKEPGYEANLPLFTMCLHIYISANIFTFPGSSGHQPRHQCQVYFVDYGNMDEVCITNIYPLPIEFFQLPCQALHIDICESYPSANSPSELIGSIVSVCVTSSYAPNSFVVNVAEVFECDNIISNHLSCFELSVPYVAFPCQAVIAHINSIADFYIYQLDKESAGKMKQLETDLQIFYSSKENHHVLNINVGIVGCVYSDICGLYCRAVILQQNLKVGLKCEVELIDYGHREEIFLQDVLELPAQFMQYPVCCIHCRLNINEDSLSDAVLKECNVFFKEKATHTRKLTVIQGQC